MTPVHPSGTTLRLCAVWLATALGVLLSGCGGGSMPETDRAVQSAPGAAQPGPVLHGHAHGGRQPIVGASILLYAAGMNGYGSTSSNLLKAPVLTDSQGVFDLNGDYTCTAGQQLYIVALGGDTGGGTNNSAGLLAALGDCAGVTASTNVELNEATTVASVFALAPFMTDAAHVGAPSANLAGMAAAFRSVNKLVDTATGMPGGPALPRGSRVAVSTLNTLADILAVCVNSRGGAAGDGSLCGRLFTLTTPAASPAPTNTIVAGLELARNPAANVAALFAMVTAASPFLPNLSVAPADWTLSVTYAGASLNHPSGILADAGGNLWISNAGNSTVSVVSQGGVPLAVSPLSGNGLSGPTTLMSDHLGRVWVANGTGASVSVFQSDGSPWTASPIRVGVNPAAMTLDLSGDMWVANAGSSSLSVVNAAGTVVQTVSLPGTSPSGLVFNPQ